MKAGELHYDNPEAIGKIVASRELWGTYARRGAALWPAARAYTRPIAGDKDVVEFVTPVAPRNSGHPIEVEWTSSQDGVHVSLDGHWVIIPIVVIRHNP